MKSKRITRLVTVIAVVLIGVIFLLSFSINYKIPGLEFLYLPDISDEDVQVIEPEPTPMPVIRHVNFKVYDPVYIAIDEGFFEDHGVKVEIIGDVLAGPNAIQAVSAGSAETGLSSLPAIINANAAGMPIQGVIDVQTSFPDQALQKWYVRADSNIESMEDVCGHTYAVNIWRSSFHYTSLRGLDQRDIDEDCVTWYLLSFSDQIPALIEGEVDVIGLMQPYQSYLEQEFGDQVKTVWTDVDDITGPSHVALIFVNRVWATHEPEQARAFVLGVRDAINWIEENQDLARPIIAKYTGIPEYAIPDYHFTENGIVDMEDIAEWMTYLNLRGDLMQDWVRAEDIATNKYNQP